MKRSFYLFLYSKRWNRPWINVRKEISTFFLMKNHEMMFVCFFKLKIYFFSLWDFLLRFLVVKVLGITLRFSDNSLVDAKRQGWDLRNPNRNFCDSIFTHFRRESSSDMCVFQYQSRLRWESISHSDKLTNNCLNIARRKVSIFFKSKIDITRRQNIFVSSVMAFEVCGDWNEFRYCLKVFQWLCGVHCTQRAHNFSQFFHHWNCRNSYGGFYADFLSISLHCYHSLCREANSKKKNQLQVHKLGCIMTSWVQWRNSIRPSCCISSSSLCSFPVLMTFFSFIFTISISFADITKNGVTLSSSIIDFILHIFLIVSAVFLN